MDQNSLTQALAGLPLSGLRYFERVGSTNDEAANWIEAHAGDLSLVVAEEQTSGRGRAGRAWRTVPGAALALSLVVYPSGEESYVLPRMTALGALAVCTALRKHYRLRAQIKWPNDVLIDREKVSGVLAEARWAGSSLEAVILGIGVNVGLASIKDQALQAGDLLFPATCVEAALGKAVEREELLHNILVELIDWRKQISSPAFLQNWEANLAFRGEWVQLSPGSSPGKDGLPKALERMPPLIQEGQILGLAPDGSLKLRTPSGEVMAVRVGEVRLRPPAQATGLE